MTSPNNEVEAPWLGRIRQRRSLLDKSIPLIVECRCLCPLRFLVSRWYATSHRLGGAGWRGSQDEEIILIREADVIAKLR